MSLQIPRIDRLLTNVLFHPVQKYVVRQNMGIPILMYHSISNTSSSTFHPYYQTHTDPELFNRQMEYLATNGYQVIPLREIKFKNHIQKDYSKKVVVLTFDDAYEDFYIHAFPVLSKYRFPATVFIPTSFIGRDLMGRKCMGWDEIISLSKECVDFGSHTVTHPILHGMPDSDLEAEIRNSKVTIEDKIGRYVDSFAYPYAFPQGDVNFINRFKKILTINGYHLGVTTCIGRFMLGQNMLFLKRIPVNAYDDIPFFKAKLEGGYDWVYFIQCLKKHIFR